MYLLFRYFSAGASLLYKNAKTYRKLSFCSNSKTKASILQKHHTKINNLNIIAKAKQEILGYFKHSIAYLH